MGYSISEKFTLDSLGVLFSLLNRLNINFFLDSGTLLKFVRNNHTFIIGSDIDIGIYEKDINKIKSFKSLLEMKGFKVKFQNNFSIFYDYIRIDFPKNYRGKSKHIDLYIYRNIKNFYVCKRPHKFSKNSLISKYLVYGINFLSKKKYKKFIFLRTLRLTFLTIYNYFGKSIQFKFPEKLLKNQSKVYYKMNEKKVFFNIPKNYHYYLTYRYSSRWRIPDKNWKSRKEKFIVIDHLRIKDCTFQN
mgnify:CR=1 FL=1